MPTPFPSAAPSSAAPSITINPPSRNPSTYSLQYIVPHTPMSAHPQPPPSPMLAPSMHSSHSVTRSQTPAPVLANEVPSVQYHDQRRSGSRSRSRTPVPVSLEAPPVQYGQHRSRSSSRSRTPAPVVTRETPIVQLHEPHHSRSRSRSQTPVAREGRSVERHDHHHHQRSSSRPRRHSSPKRRPIIVLQPPNTNIIVVPQKLVSGKNRPNHRKSSSHGAILIDGHTGKPYSHSNGDNSVGLPEEILQQVQQAMNGRANQQYSSSGPHRQNLAQQAQHIIGGILRPYLHHHSSSNQIDSYFPRPEHPAYNPVSFPNPQSTFEYSRCTGKKRALCIGINYTGQDRPLRGCVNDARHMREFLIRRHGFKAEDIVLLTDDSSNPKQQPTKRNMLEAMRWLVRDARPHDSLFFHYSGHGSRTEDLDGDELDGYDEIIMPVDYKKRGHILDDELHSTMVKPLPPGCRLTAIFDSCHSGTVLDLPYVYTPSGRLKGVHVSGRALRRKASRADVISWSGCQDDQTSADTFQGGVAVGAMSYAFISSMRKNPEQSYQDLLKSVRTIVGERFKQTPQLGSSHHIDTTLKFII